MMNLAPDMTLLSMKDVVETEGDKKEMETATTLTLRTFSSFTLSIS